MKKWLLALGLGSMLILGACGGGDSDSSSDGGDSGDSSVAAGEQAYKDSCSSCHGNDLKGIGSAPLTDIGSKLSVDEIVNIIENGTGGGMPPIKGLTDDEMVEIAEWLHTQ